MRWCCLNLYVVVASHPTESYGRSQVRLRLGYCRDPGQRSDLRRTGGAAQPILAPSRVAAPLDSVSISANVSITIGLEGGGPQDIDGDVETVASVQTIWQRQMRSGKTGGNEPQCLRADTTDILNRWPILRVANCTESPTAFPCPRSAT